MLDGSRFASVVAVHLFLPYVCHVLSSLPHLSGADITDYFNYGFTEETWRLYSEKQRRMKAEVIQLNKIAVSPTLPPGLSITHPSLLSAINLRWYCSYRIVDFSLFSFSGNSNCTCRYELRNMVMLMSILMFAVCHFCVKSVQDFQFYESHFNKHNTDIEKMTSF